MVLSTPLIEPQTFPLSTMTEEDSPTAPDIPSQAIPFHLSQRFFGVFSQRLLLSRNQIQSQRPGAMLFVQAPSIVSLVPDPFVLRPFRS